MRSIEYKPIFEATRGDLVESIHSGAFAVVNNQGDLMASWGDPESITYLRSSAKSFQAIPVAGDRTALSEGATSPNNSQNETRGHQHQEFTHEVHAFL